MTKQSTHTMIKMVGPFTAAEVAEFVALLRRIDDAKPTSVYRLVIEDTRSMDEAERFMADVLPAVPGRVTTLARAAYRDDKYHPRSCDRCGETYRGPAIYCSFECAIADA